MSADDRTGDAPQSDDPTFRGVHRPDGSVGARDRVLVLPSVICSHEVAERIADRAPAAVATPHDHGCAQIGADSEQTERAFLGIAQNPNVAGALVVGLGCEHHQSDEVAAKIADLDVPVREISIQAAGGTEECIEAGVAAAEELAEERAPDRAPADLADLTVGVVGSDLAGSTREIADPLVGELVREVVDAGGRAVVAGNERLVADPPKTREAVADAAEADLDALFDRHDGQPARATRVAREAVEAGFEASTRAWGGLPVDEVLAYGEQPESESGLSIVDAPSRFEEAATALAGAGAQVVIHVTADGVTTGHPLVPTIKVTGDAATADALPADIDVDATESDLSDLRDRLLAVAGGDSCCAETHGVTAFAITRVGPSM